MNHTFDVAIAEEYGMNCAVILENLRFWIAKNVANGAHYHDGRYWTYNSIKALTKLFPYLTEKQIRSALDRLEDAGIIITGNYNSLPFDRTKWYALTEFGESLCPVGKPQLPCREAPIAPEGEPIPDINTDINTDINKREGHSPSRPRTGARTHTRKYGQYNNVRLTPEELAQLKERFPREWSERIDRLSEYIASKGDKYKSHYATLLSWARRDAAAGSGAPAQAQQRAPKINPAQQYGQRKYDDEKIKSRVAVDFAALDLEEDDDENADNAKDGS